LVKLGKIYSVGWFVQFQTNNKTRKATQPSEI